MGIGRGRTHLFFTFYLLLGGGLQSHTRHLFLCVTFLFFRQRSTYNQKIAHSYRLVVVEGRTFLFWLSSNNETFIIGLFYYRRREGRTRILTSTRSSEDIESCFFLMVIYLYIRLYFDTILHITLGVALAIDEGVTSPKQRENV